MHLAQLEPGSSQEMAGAVGAGLAEHRRNVRIVASGSGVSMVGMLGQRGLSYLFSILVAQAVGATSYGLYNWAWATVNLVKILAQFGLNQGGQRFMARYRALGDEASERRLVRYVTLLVTFWSGLVALALLVCADWIARLSGQDPEAIASLLRWFALSVPGASLLLVLSSFSDGQRKIWHGVVARDLVQPATALLLAWLLLGAGLNLVGAVQAYVVSTVLAVVVAFFFLRAYFQPARGPLVDGQSFSRRAVINFSLPFVPMTLLRQTTGLKLEIYLLSYLASAADVGVFSAAAGTAFLISFGLNAVIRIYSTMATELHAKKEIGQLERLLQTVTYWSTCLSLPGVIALGLFGSQVLGLFGEQFSAEGSAALMVLVLGQLANAVTGPVGVTLTMAGYSRLILVTNLVTLVVNIVLDWWLISVWGVMGAAVGNTVVMTGMNLAYMIEAKKLVGVWSLNKSLLRPVAASAAALGVMLPLVGLLDRLPVIIGLVAGLGLMAVVYVVALWLLSPRQERAAITTALKEYLHR